ncbi:MAG TPA: efflux RND transporter periplasmic adaptor subunit [Blastocatellia bacterium]
MAVNETTEIEARHAEDDFENAPPPGRMKFFVVVFVVGAGIVLGIVIFLGIRSRVAAQTTLKAETQDESVPRVYTVNPAASAPALEIVLPGNTQAFIDAPIYARTNGYLKRWYFDIGARVKKGELLADIETPEVDQQLQQARADLETAQANLNLSRTTATRYQSLVKSGSVSQQDTDNATGDFSAKKAAADSADANVHRLEQLQSFEKVYAPFDGVITARSTDIGQLIDAGSGAQGGKELFHMAATDKLRVFVAVPEIYSRAAKGGATVNLTLDEYPGQTFTGTLVRNSNSIDATSRTLLVEVDVNNSQRLLLPGAYAFVHLKLPEQIQSVTVPANTLLFRSEGLRVGVVRDDKAQLVPVTIGRDYGNTVEIVSGLQTSDAVIVDPPDSLIDGEQVHVGQRTGGTPGQQPPSQPQTGNSDDKPKQTASDKRSHSSKQAEPASQSSVEAGR